MSEKIIVEKIPELCTGALYDVLTYELKTDRPFLLGPDIRLHAGRRVFGPAFTIQGRYNPNRTVTAPEKAVVIKLLKDMYNGCVAVLQTGYQGPVGCFGGFTAALYKSKGCVGFICDGYTRDMEELRRNEFPTWCHGMIGVNGFGSAWQLAAWQETIHLRGVYGERVRIEPGDYIFGDVDGVVVIPGNSKKEVLERSVARLANENQLRERLRDGSLGVEELEKSIFQW